MSVSAVAPTPFYQDPERLPIGLPQAKAAESSDKAQAADGNQDKHLSMFAEGDDSPSFWDVLDVINPLQHIPIVNDIYRDLTGDKIGVGARLVGGALFGGVIGLAAATVNCVVEESSGKDIGDHMLALFKDDQPAQPGDAPAPTMVADKAPAVPASAPAAAETPAVSSSPAQVNAAAAAPVIALPQEDAPIAGAQPMVFTLDGMQPAAAPAAASAPAPVPAPRTPVELAQAAPRPLTGPAARMMPTPSRNLNAAPSPLPPVSVPVSNSSARSNVPVTGRAPNAGANAAATRALAAQPGLNNPMLPPADAQGQTAAAPDWFSTAWGQALDKYQKGSQLGAKTSTTSTLQ